MEAFEPPRPPLPAGYYYPDEGKAAYLHSELLRVLSDGHAFFGVPFQTFAVREQSADVLFQFRGNLRRFAVIHLSRLGADEVDAEHPKVSFVGTFAEFIERESAPDNS